MIDFDNNLTSMLICLEIYSELADLDFCSKLFYYCRWTHLSSLLDCFKHINYNSTIMTKFLHQ